MKQIPIIFAIVVMLIVGVDSVGANSSDVMPFSLVAENRALESSVNRINVMIPIYNDLGLTEVIEILSPYINSGDIFFLVSGNNGNSLDVSWLNQSSIKLNAAFPNNSIMAMTAGLNNVYRIAYANLSAHIEGVAYVYEPNMDNEPEFTWDFDTTVRNFERVSGILHLGGLRLIGKPTGRPILEKNLQKYSWDYGVLARQADEMFIQTQTWCKQGRFGEALDQLTSQYNASGTTSHWYPQVTVDSKSTNGVTPHQAAECADIAASRGLTRISMWWSPRHTDEAIEFLGLLGR